MDTHHLVVLVTAPNTETGEKIAKALVETKLAACVNILPGITSVYTWEDEVCNEAEVLLIIKTQSHLFETLNESIQSMHPYQVPEVIATPIVAGASSYLDWIAHVTLRK